MLEQRNIGILAHVDAGKTTLTEWLLYYGGVIRRPGSVDSGTTVTDWLEEEQQRGITIGSSTCRFNYEGTVLTLIDTPGHVDFGNEVDRSLQVIDGGILVISAYDGVQPQTESIWRRARARSLPCIACINKADKLQYSLEELLEHLRVKLDVVPLPLEVAKLDEEGSLWIMDVISGSVAGNTNDAIPADIHDWLLLEKEFALEVLLDALSLLNDELALRLLQNERPTAEVIYSLLAHAVTQESRFLPYQFTAAKQGFNVDSLLQKILGILPKPKEIRLSPDGDALGENRLLCFVFKTEQRSNWQHAHIKVNHGTLLSTDEIWCANQSLPFEGSELCIAVGKDVESVHELTTGSVGLLRCSGTAELYAGAFLSNEPHRWTEQSSAQQIFVESAIEAPDSETHEQMVENLKRFCLHDPSYSLRYDVEKGCYVVGGRGELHLQVLLGQLQRQLKVPLKLYPSTVKEYRYLEEFTKMFGEAYQNEACVRLSVSLEPSNEIEWLFDDSSTEVTKRAIKAGGESALGWDGGMASPFAPLKINVEILEARAADHLHYLYRDAIRAALLGVAEIRQVTLQEPWIKCSLTVPMNAVGRTIAALQRQGVQLRVGETLGDFQLLEGDSPLRALLGLTTELRDISSGRTSWSYESIGYRVKKDRVPV